MFHGCGPLKSVLGLLTFLIESSLSSLALALLPSYTGKGGCSYYIIAISGGWGGIIVLLTQLNTTKHWMAIRLSALCVLGLLC